MHWRPHSIHLYPFPVRLVNISPHLQQSLINSWSVRMWSDKSVDMQAEGCDGVLIRKMTNHVHCTLAVIERSSYSSRKLRYMLSSWKETTKHKGKANSVLGTSGKSRWTESRSSGVDWRHRDLLALYWSPFVSEFAVSALVQQMTKSCWPVLKTWSPWMKWSWACRMDDVPLRWGKCEFKASTYEMNWGKWSQAAGSKCLLAGLKVTEGAGERGERGLLCSSVGLLEGAMVSTSVKLPLIQIFINLF